MNDNERNKAMRLSKMLKLYRAAEGIDQKALAREIGIGASQLCRLEHGKELRLASIVKLLKWMFE